MQLNKYFIIFSLSFLLCIPIIFAVIFLKLPYPSPQSLSITQGYDGFTHQNKDFYALDFSGKISEIFDKPVISAADGKIYKINNSNKYGGGYGYYVQIIHGDNLISIYAHLNRVNPDIYIDKTVYQGELIGTIGNTGKVSPLPTSDNPYPGTHLHFAMYQKQTDGSLAAYKPEPISGYSNIVAGMTLTSDNILVENKPKGLLSFLAGIFTPLFDILNPPKAEAPLLVTTPPTITEQPPQNNPVQIQTATNTTNTTESPKINSQPQPLPLPPASSPPQQIVEHSVSNNFSYVPGFGGGSAPAPAAIPSPAAPPQSAPMLIDTTPPDISLSISECESSLSNAACLVATLPAGGLNIVWSSSADDLDYFEFNNNGSISTTTATSTMVVVTDNSTNYFSVRAKDKTGNWSEPQLTTVVVCSTPVVINEVAWAGTPGHPEDEWLELYNRTAEPVSLDNWVLQAEDGVPYINLSGIIPAHDYYLIERTDDTTVSDIPADLVAPFSGTESGSALSDFGETLILVYASTTIDSTPSGQWRGGNMQGWTMERYDPDIPGTDVNNWASNNYNGAIKNGKNADSHNINGTPKARNSINYLIAKGATNISSDITLTKSKSPYLVNNNRQIFQKDSVLTIEPGVVIKFFNDAGMNFSDNAKIIAKGTESDPIVFTSLNDDGHGGGFPGSWYGVSVNSSNNDSVFDHVIMRYGGKYYSDGGYPYSNLEIQDNSSLIANSIFEYSKIYGLKLINSHSEISNNIFQYNNQVNDPSGYNSALYVWAGAPEIRANTFSNNRRGIYNGSAQAIIDANNFSSNAGEAILSDGAVPVFANNIGSGNAVNAIVIAGDLTQPNSTSTLKSNSLPYYLGGAGMSTVSASSTLIIEPGVVIKRSKMQYSNPFNIYGNLLIEGNNFDDVVFTHVSDDSVGGDTLNDGDTVGIKGDWLGLVFQPGSYSSIKGATFKYAGTALTFQNSPINLENVKFLENNLALSADPDSLAYPVKASNIIFENNTSTTTPSNLW